VRTRTNTDEVLPIAEWHHRYADRYTLFERLEYTDTAQITKARLLAHASTQEELVPIQEKFLDEHPSASVGIDWTGPLVPKDWIGML
jgi:hypothetical protein